MLTDHSDVHQASVLIIWHLKQFLNHFSVVLSQEGRTPGHARLIPVH